MTGRRSARDARACWLACSALATALCACSPARVSLEVLFPTQDDQFRTGSVHVWVIGAEGRDTPPTCEDLRTGNADPYDATLRRLADTVFLLPVDAPPRIGGVELGAALVYVEGVDRGGVTFLSGCTAARVRGGVQPITVRLWAAGAFDCADPGTPPGAPCNDGMRCTTGENCSGGACGGSTVVDCTFLADSCNDAACDETAGGCVVTPLPDGTTCDDGRYCVNAETCAGGSCVGTPVDCSGLDDACNVGDCDEATDGCVTTPRFDGYPCDDGLYCTQFDECMGGTCEGGFPRSCSFLDDECNAGACNEPMLTCVQNSLPSGTACNDFDSCTTGDACNAGTCNGAPIDADADGFSPAPCDFPADCNDGNPAVSPADAEGPMGNPTCTDGLDNDCDGFSDAADTAC